MHDLLLRAMERAASSPLNILPGLARSCAQEAVHTDLLSSGQSSEKLLDVLIGKLLGKSVAMVRERNLDNAIAFLEPVQAVVRELGATVAAGKIAAQITALRQASAAAGGKDNHLRRNVPDPLVSVVVPCYNQASFLPEAVSSLGKQTHANVEVIVVNDGSADATESVAQDLVRKYPRLHIRVISQENKGLPAARNAGFAAAQGEYVVPLDADDMLAPAFIEQTLSILVMHPDVGFAYSDIQHFGEQADLFELPPFDSETLLRRDNIVAVSALVRKAAWSDAGGYNELMREGYEDWDFWISCVEKGWSGHHIPEPLFNYRVRSGSMLHRANQRRGYLVARIVTNHPALYDAATLQWADGMLAESTVEA
jgi:hypothetical protein